MTKLNLSICQDTKIDIYIPISLSEDDLLNSNPNSDLYNDLCFSITNENGLYKPLKVRQEEFVNKNLSICEENCEFSEYDNITKKVICSCFIKLQLPLISEIRVDKEKLIANLKNIKNVANFKLLKCHHLLFNKNNIFKNTSNYLALFLLLLSIIAIFYFIFYNKNKIQEYINSFQEKEESGNKKIRNNKKSRKSKDLNNKIKKKKFIIGYK